MFEKNCCFNFLPNQLFTSVMNATETADQSIDNESEDEFTIPSFITIVIFSSVLCLFLIFIGLCAAYECFKITKRKRELEASSHIENNKQTGNAPKNNGMHATSNQESNKNDTVRSNPEHVAIDMAPSINRQHTFFRTLNPERRAKKSFSFIIILSILVLLFVGSLKSQSKYHMFAYLLTVLVIIWNISFSAILLSSEHLHMITVKRKRLNNSQFLFVPYEYVEDKHRLITSVSAINAIGGSNAERYSLLTMYITFGVLYCAVFSKWTEEHSSTLNIELVLMMLDAVGLLMVFVWEIEPNTFSNIAHYIAAGITVICSPAAFAMQQNFSWFSIAAVSITYIGLIEWFALLLNLPAKHEDLSVVHRCSKISIINEVIVLMLSYSCGVMFIYNLDQ